MSKLMRDDTPEIRAFRSILIVTLALLVLGIIGTFPRCP